MATAGLVDAGKEFIFNFMEGGIYNGVESVGKIYVTNPNPTTATVNIRTPLIPSGMASVNVILAVSGGSSMDISLNPETSLSGIGKELKGEDILTYIIIPTSYTHFQKADDFRCLTNVNFLELGMIYHGEMLLLTYPSYLLLAYQ